VTVAAPTVDDADALAARGHHGQTYGPKDDPTRCVPYIEHPRAVARLVHPYGPDAVIAALLHDTVEDTANKPEPITLTGLRSRGYSRLTANAVDAVSRRPGETYPALIGRACADPAGRIIKIADNTHNRSGLHNLPGERARTLQTRYDKAYTRLYSALLNSVLAAATQTAGGPAVLSGDGTVVCIGHPGPEQVRLAVADLCGAVPGRYRQGWAINTDLTGGLTIATTAVTAPGGAPQPVRPCIVGAFEVTVVVPA
jgi:hypothetical protein